MLIAESSQPCHRTPQHDMNHHQKEYRPTVLATSSTFRCLKRENIMSKTLCHLWFWRVLGPYLRLVLKGSIPHRGLWSLTCAQKLCLNFEIFESLGGKQLGNPTTLGHRSFSAKKKTLAVVGCNGLMEGMLVQCARQPFTST